MSAAPIKRARKGKRTPTTTTASAANGSIPMPVARIRVAMPNSIPVSRYNR